MFTMCFKPTQGFMVERHIVQWIGDRGIIDRLLFDIRGIWIYDMLQELIAMHMNELHVTLVVLSSAIDVNILNNE